MKYINALRKISYILAAFWAAFVISITVEVIFNPGSYWNNNDPAWEGFLIGVQPLIYVYLVFKYIIPYLIEIHESNKEDAESHNTSPSSTQDY